MLMNKYQKELIQSQINDEKAVLKALEELFEQALKDIDTNISDLLARLSNDNLQSVIYQLDYQKALKKQINAALDDLNAKQFNAVTDYLKTCYETGYIGTMYDIQNQGIPIIQPIQQDQVVQALTHDTKLSKSLYESLGYNVSELKKQIASELSRGISSAMSYIDIARNIERRAKTTLSKSMTIARTEGHRITQMAAYNAQRAAKDTGAEIVKQWDSTLDRRTRKSHRRVDGEIRELDEKFSNGLMFPGDPNGKAAEVINCRCVTLQRAKWALDEEELETLKSRAAYYELNKTKNFDEYKRNFLNYTENMIEVDNFCDKFNITKEERASIYRYISSDAYIVNEALRNNNVSLNHSEFINTLDTALSKCPNYKGNLQRSIYFYNQNNLDMFLNEHSIGKVVQYKEFISTTKGTMYNPEAQIQIYIADSRHGKDISVFNFKEQEILYERNSSFIVSNVIEKDGKYYIRLVEME